MAFNPEFEGTPTGIGGGGWRGKGRLRTRVGVAGAAGAAGGGGGSESSGSGWLGAAISAIPAAIQGIEGISQRNKAQRLNKKDFDFMPTGLLENKQLAKQQAYSRTAPGSALANENIRRNQANTLSAAQRMYGGDTNKMAAMAAGSQVHADDASKQIAVMGKQFSENALARLQQANSQIAGQERQNYSEYWKTKSALLYASDQNIFNALNNAATVGMSYYQGRQFDKNLKKLREQGEKGGGGGDGMSLNQGQGWAPWMQQNNNSNMYPPNYNPYQQAPKMASPYAD